MNSATYMDVATVVTNLKMYPYFDVAHYILACVAVREDILLSQPQQTGGSGGGQRSPPHSFSRKHPLSSWLSSMLICFAGSIIANFVLGEPIITPFKDHQNVLTATAVWYLVNFAPFDLIYKLYTFLPIQLAICVMKETQRAHSVFHGVLVAKKLFPTSYVIIILVGTIKGAGSGLMKGMDRLVRGVWIPGSSEILQPSFTTKASLVASIILACDSFDLIPVPHPLIFVGIVMFFVNFRISSLMFGFTDPFLPIEELLSSLFMGGTTKASLIAAVIFLYGRLALIPVPHPLIYFGIVMFLVYFKISSVVLGIHDPFVPIENLFCALFMGGLLDALQKTISKESVNQDESKDSNTQNIKNKETKKKE